MSAVDKFGRPLQSEPIFGSTAAVVEGIQMDVDRQYDSRGKRIKNVAEPKDETDAVNKLWVNARLKDFRTNIQNFIGQVHDDLTEKLYASESRIKKELLGEKGSVVVENDQDRYDVSAEESRR